MGFIDSCINNNDTTSEVWNNIVIPAKAGIQLFCYLFLDSCLRRSDKSKQFPLTLVSLASIAHAEVLQYTIFWIVIV
jgi:hypothetical protein